MYELHALLAGTIAFLLMFWVKKPIKEEISSFVEKKAVKSRRWREKSHLYRKRLGLLLIALDLLLSGAIFGILSVVSPLIHFSVRMLWLSGILSLTEYAIYEQLTYGRKKAHHE